MLVYLFPFVRLFASRLFGFENTRQAFCCPAYIPKCSTSKYIKGRWHAPAKSVLGFTSSSNRLWTIWDHLPYSQTFFAIGIGGFTTAYITTISFSTILLKNLPQIVNPDCGITRQNNTHSNSSAITFKTSSWSSTEVRNLSYSKYTSFRPSRIF